MRRFLCALAAAAAASSGCALTSVQVVYPRPDTPALRARARTLGNLYLLVERPKPPEDGIADRAVAALGGDRLGSFPVAAGTFAKEAARVVADHGGYVLAYRATEDAEAPDPYLSKLEPAGTLVARFGPLEIERTETETEERVKGKDGAEEVVRKPLWHFKARLGLRASLRSEPDGAVVSESQSVVESEQDVARKPGEDKPRLEWYEEAQDGLLAGAARRLAALLGPMPSARLKREVHTDEKDPASVAARKAAAKGEWEKASELWAARLDSGKGGWRELMDLAVAAEVRREFQEAGRVYRLARERSAAEKDPEAAKVEWDKLLAEVDGAAETVGPRSRAARDWFAAPVAVLPFSDETTSVDGPELVRLLAHSTLRKGGYAVQEPEDVDRGLREHGFSQGGQLKRVKPVKIAGWLGAERLLYGNVSDFEDVMLGVYGRRKVAGTLSLWDKSAGDTTWTGEAPVVREAPLALSASEAAGRFMGQLLRGLAERMVGRPLYAESALFVERNLETLPLAPER